VYLLCPTPSSAFNSRQWAPRRAFHSFYFVQFISHLSEKFNLLLHNLRQLYLYHTNNNQTTMAKSLRSKVKQAAGRKRRTDSHYAVAEAARIQRLSDKLLGDSAKQDENKVEVEGEGDDAEMKDG